MKKILVLISHLCKINRNTFLFFAILCTLTFFSCSGEIKEGNDTWQTTFNDDSSSDYQNGSEEDPFEEIPNYDNYDKVFSTDKDFTYEINDNETVTITGLRADRKNTITELTIPASIEGHQVTTIADKAFSECSNIRNVLISEGVSTLEGVPFYNMPTLKKISYPSTLDINTIPGVKTWNSEYEITLAEGFTEIPARTFYNLYGLKRINLPSTIKKICSSAFFCPDLESVTLPDGLEEIEGGAFSGCVKLKQINLPTSLKRIAWYYSRQPCFYNCGLTELIVPGDIEFGSGGLCRFCENLTKVTFQGNIKTFENALISDCHKLESLTINVEIPIPIGNNGCIVENCNGLKTIFLNSWYLGVLARNCNNLETVYINANNLDHYYHTASACCIKSCKKLKNIIIGDSVENASIDLSESTSVDNISYSNSLKELALVLDGNVVFEELEFESLDYLKLVGKNMKNLKKVNLKDLKLDYIDLKGSTQLKTVSLDNIYTKRWDLMNLSDCTSLSEIKLKDADFLPCNLSNTALTEVIFQSAEPYYYSQRDILSPDTEEHVGKCCLENCNKLQKVCFNNTPVPQYLFGINGRSEYVEMNLDLATMFCDYAFYNCDFLTEFNWTAQPTPPNYGHRNVIASYFGAYAFAECDNLKSVTIHDYYMHHLYGFPSPSEYAIDFLPGTFSNCRNLEKVVTDYPIGDWSEKLFYNCENLKYISLIDRNKTTIEDKNEFYTQVFSYAFFNCKSLDETVGLDFADYEILPVLCRGKRLHVFDNSTFHSDELVCRYTLFDQALSEMNVKSLVLSGADAIDAREKICIGNKYIENVTFEDTGNSSGIIGEQAFKDCISLKTVHLGQSLSLYKVSEDSFDGCSELESIFVPKEQYEQYIESEMWAQYRDKIISQ